MINQFHDDHREMIPAGAKIKEMLRLTQRFLFEVGAL